MGDIAIRVENLSKRYRIRHGTRARYDTLRDALSYALRAPLHRLRTTLRRQPDRGPLTADDVSAPAVSGRPSADGSEEYVWALKDVSFEVKRGEVVGIIGRNGAGKTALLKVLSRITEPTSGYAEVRGRVGSLLEVGTGFHPELTGRENIYLNGAILGMKKHEIDRKFDEIVAFAEVEKFIDTPVKFYSSGMYVRLAFAVAAHLDPEILLVDEVLAVGDAAFQKKCLGKMGEVAGEGRTVLFVSHNMAAVSHLCNRAICLARGAVIAHGSTDYTIERYMLHSNASANLGGGTTQRSRYLEKIDIVRSNGRSGQSVLVGEPIGFRVRLKHTKALVDPIVSIFICDHWGTRLIMLGTRIQGNLSVPRANKVTLLVETEPLNLLPGRYSIDVGIGAGPQVVEYHHNVAQFDVEFADVFASGRLPITSRQGIIAQKAEWRVAEVQ